MRNDLGDEEANKFGKLLATLDKHSGEEVAAEVIDGPQSVVFDEAENRLHVQKAILTMLVRRQCPTPDFSAASSPPRLG